MDKSIQRPGLLQPTDVVSVKVVSLSEVGQRKTFKIGWTVIRKPVMIERCGYDKKMYNNVVSGMSQVRATMLGKRAYPATYKGWRVIIDN